MRRLPALAALLALLASLASLPAARAGSISVSPVRADLDHRNRIASLTLRNGGTEPTVVQLQPMIWRQANGQDVLEPTRDLLATPPIFTLAPGATQIVRVGLRREPDAARELSFRLILQEVPPPPKPGFAGLRVALKLSVPVFVAPAGKAAPALRWALVSDGAGQRLRVVNDGNAHARVGSLVLTSRTGETVGPVEVGVYVLPGQWRELKVPGAPAGGGLRVTARTSRGELAADVAADGAN